MTLFHKKMPMLLCAMALMFPPQITEAAPTKSASAAAPSTNAGVNASAALTASLAADSTKGLFVILSDADPMTQMMALVLSTQTLDQGKSLQMMLCGPAGKLAVKNSEETMLKPINKSPQMLLASLIARGVTVEVCPLFLPNNNMTEAQLISGVSVAKPPVVAAKMRADGVKLFTF